MYNKGLVNIHEVTRSQAIQHHFPSNNTVTMHHFQVMASIVDNPFYSQHQQ